MLINTKNFGEVEINENDVFTFEEGIPGFPKLKKYTIIRDHSDDYPFYWMQSLDDSEICFIIMDVFNILPDYNPIVNDDELKYIGNVEGNNLLIYNIVVIPECVSKMSVNLKAPIVINLDTKKGRQIIVNNDEYEIRYYFYEEMKKQKKEEH